MVDRLNEAEQLYRQGRLAEAQRSCDGLLAVDPDNARAWYLAGIIAHKLGNSTVAADRMKEAVRLAPTNPECLTHASEVFRRAGRLDEAVAAARAAVQQWPEHPAPQNNLGLALKDADQPEEAEACFRKALAIDASYFRAYLNLGNLLHSLDRSTEAYRQFEQALRIRPDYPEALNSAGQLSKELGRSQAAVQLLQRALQLRPGYPKAQLNLANALADLKQVDESERMLVGLTKSHPDYVEAFHDLGALYERQKKVPDAVTAYRRVLELQPDSPQALAALENAKRNICDWSDWPDSVERLIQASQACLAAGKPSPFLPLVSCRFPTTSEHRFKIACHHAARVTRRVGGVSLADDPNCRARAVEPTRIRLAFLSHEFRYHVVSHLMLGLFRRFSREQFEVFAFDYSPDDSSEMRQTIINDVDQFIRIPSGTDRSRAERIFKEAIHILVDVNSYMPGGRPGIAGHRPAPIQISHMYPATTGASHIDYFITDPFVSPAGDENYFTEKLIYLPCCYLPTDSDQVIATDTPSRAECGLPEHGIVFCSFNKSDKIEPHLFDVWMRILDQTPSSVLWLRNDGPAAAENLRREAAARCIDPDRLVFAQEVPGIPEHLARQRNADLFLDTWTHGAHGTAVDALWAGLPLLTCPGRTFTSRVAASLLTAVGLTELIVEDLEEYESLAVKLAADSARLAALRQSLEQKRQQGELLSTDRYTRNLERGFLAVWEKHRSGAPPGPVVIDE